MPGFVLLGGYLIGVSLRVLVENFVFFHDLSCRQLDVGMDVSSLSRWRNIFSHLFFLGKVVALSRPASYYSFAGGINWKHVAAQLLLQEGLGGEETHGGPTTLILSY